MTDEIAIELPGANFTEQDLVDFLTEFTGDSVCPFCAHDIWTIIVGPGEKKYLHIPSTGGDRSKEDKHLPVYGAACAKCGFIRLHTLNPVMDWKAAKNKEASE